MGRSYRGPDFISQQVASKFVPYFVVDLRFSNLGVKIS